MEKRQTFDFWSLRRPKELSDCGRSSPAFESLGRQFEPARAERTSSSGLAEAGESQNCLSRKRGRKTIKRGLRVSRPLVLEKNGGEFLFHSHFFALSLAPVVSLSPGSHLVRARSLFLSFPFSRPHATPASPRCCLLPEGHLQSCPGGRSKQTNDRSRFSI